ncbi:hypothetical protein B0T22DRAFT_458216 [Podospora appendiculata]|uniref:Extracellular membrane protein CFEM domain-containing protein n=1 Tax=Podospora appendiculata TaxID=314037 RepID=A0AAE1CBX3_9PEZI|nr:hypothetical protein B0T22DRAFT_458216 [Podospora appendiculata]
MRSFFSIIASLLPVVAIAVAHDDSSSAYDPHVGTRTCSDADDIGHHSTSTIFDSDCDPHHGTCSGGDDIDHPRTTPSVTVQSKVFPASSTVVSGCPALVKTVDICSTCVTPDCIVFETITANCDCPGPVVTLTRSHPCDLGCADLGCGTAYTVVSATGCSSTTRTSTASITPTITTASTSSTSTDSASTASVSSSSSPITQAASTTTTSSQSVVPSTSSAGAARGPAPFRLW